MVRVEEKDRCPDSWVLYLARSRIHYTASCWNERTVREWDKSRQAKKIGKVL